MLTVAKQQQEIKISSSSPTSPINSKKDDNERKIVEGRNPATTKVKSTKTTTTTNKKKMFHRTLEIIDALLKKDRIDANLLGMESLQLLTNPHSSSKAMNHFVANIILMGGESGCVSGSSIDNHHGSEFNDIKDIVSSLITKYTNMDEHQHHHQHHHHESETNIDDGCSSTTSSGESSLNNDVEDGYYQKMRVCALSILSNSLKTFFEEYEDSLDHNDNIVPTARSSSINDDTRSSTSSISLSKYHDIESTLSSDEWVGNHGLFAMLMNQLRHAKIHPHEAYLASCCLETLLIKSIQIRDYVCKERLDDVYGIVKDSLDVGQASYPLLGMVSSKILDLLGESKE